MTIDVRSITIVARDGFPLAATLFNAPKPAAVLTIASALGVTRKHYVRFARYISKFAIATVTFDYRGIGDSGPAWRKDAKGGLTDLPPLASAIWMRSFIGCKRLHVINYLYSL